eukprot:13572.XXX_205481_205927_1 [CDS] Oithona nana genome sequencing.
MVSSGFPGCSRDDGTAMNSVFNTISSIVLVIHMVLAISNSISNNNNNNDQNNNNNANNNVFEYNNNFVSMNMNTADSMGGNGALGRKKRRVRTYVYQLNEFFDDRDSRFNVFSKLYVKAITSRIYKCFL